MVYFFHHYELPVIVQQAQLQQMFMRSTRNNNNNRQAENNGQAAAGGGIGNQQMNRENQQAPNEAPIPVAPERPVNNANNMFVIRGAYRRRVNHLVERLRNNFYNNVFGVGIIADNNNNNANNLQNQPGFNHLTRSLRLLNTLFPNRPILNVRIINVRSASASATVADILRTAEGQLQQNQAGVSQPVEAESAAAAGEAPSVERLETQEQERQSNVPPATAPTLSDEEFEILDSSPANDVNVKSENSIKHRETGDGDVNNSVNVMQSATSGDGESSQTTSSSNEQC